MVKWTFKLAVMDHSVLAFSWLILRHKTRENNLPQPSKASSRWCLQGISHGHRTQRSWETAVQSSVREFLTRNLLWLSHSFCGASFEPCSWKSPGKPCGSCRLRSSLPKALSLRLSPGHHDPSRLTTPSGLQFSFCLRSHKCTQLLMALIGIVLFSK